VNSRGARGSECLDSIALSYLDIPHSGFGPNVNAQADMQVDLGLEPTFNVQAENKVNL